MEYEETRDKEPIRKSSVQVDIRALNCVGLTAATSCIIKVLCGLRFRQKSGAGGGGGGGLKPVSYWRCFALADPGVLR